MQRPSLRVHMNIYLHLYLYNRFSMLRLPLIGYSIFLSFTE